MLHTTGTAQHQAPASPDQRHPPRARPRRQAQPHERVLWGGGVICKHTKGGTAEIENAKSETLPQHSPSKHAVEAHRVTLMKTPRSRTHEAPLVLGTRAFLNPSPPSRRNTQDITPSSIPASLGNSPARRGRTLRLCTGSTLAGEKLSLQDGSQLCSRNPQRNLPEERTGSMPLWVT